MSQQDRRGSRRSYGDSCGIARALDVVGERWALLVTRELLLGPKRFTDLRRGLPNIGPDLLAARLRELEAAGVVRRRRLPTPAAARVYELTDWGRELSPVLVALGRWGSRAPLGPQAPPLGVDALVIALQTMFDPARAHGLSHTFELWLGDEVFSLRVDDGRLGIERGTGATADASIHTDTGTLAAVLWHERPLDGAIADAMMQVDGDRGAAEQLMQLFPPSTPAPGEAQAA